MLKRAAYLQVPIKEIIQEEEQLDATAEPLANKTIVLPLREEQIIPSDKIRQAYLKVTYPLPTFYRIFSHTTEKLEKEKRIFGRKSKNVIYL